MRLTDGTSTLDAAYGEYLIEPRLAFFRTRVVAHDSSSILNADSARYDRNRKFTEAWGRVVLYQKEDAITISGGRFDHDAVRQYSRMTEAPVLVQRDTTGGTVDTLIVRSRVMESFRDSTRLMVAQDSVQIVRRDLAGTCRNGDVSYKGRQHPDAHVAGALVRRDPGHGRFDQRVHAVPRARQDQCDGECIRSLGKRYGVHRSVRSALRRDAGHAVRAETPPPHRCGCAGHQPVFCL